MHSCAGMGILNDTMLDMLATVADTAEREDMRMDALAEIVASLPPSHPYRLVAVETLYTRLLPDFACRLYLVNGRGTLRQVSRPPISLQDVL
jgi:hypothetical protein